MSKLCNKVFLKYLEATGEKYDCDIIYVLSQSVIFKETISYLVSNLWVF